MSDLQDNTLPTTPSPASEPVDSTSAQNAIDAVTATPTTPEPTQLAEMDKTKTESTAETKLDQAVPAMNPLPSAPPTTSQMPEPTPAPETVAATPAMGDDTPLAFAAKPTTVTTTSESTTTTTETVPPSIGSSYLPPTTPPTTPVAAPSTSEEPKKKAGSKIKMLVLGFVSLLGVLGGIGYYAYYRWGTADIAQVVTINAITSKEDCSGCSRDVDGGWLVWRNGECKVTGICNSSKEQKNTEEPAGTPVPNTNTKAGCELPGNQGGPGGAWCTGCGGFCNLTKDKGCYTLQEAKCGEGQQKGANIVSCSGSFAKDCRDKCGVCFDRTGECSKITTVNGKDVEMGLCGIVNQVGTPGSPTSNIGTQYYFCPGMVDETQYGCQIPGKPSNPNCFCGTIQIDTPGKGFTSTTMKCGCGGSEPSEPPTTTTTPTMACTGLTRSPNTTPKIGDTLTFTCAGSVTPSTAGTLSYKFRYKIGSGALTTLPNKSATTAELTLAACGTYTVECQACTTLNGVLTCDPKWTGATQ